MQTEFEPATENRALKEAIITRMQREGGISFRDFMQMALYEPGLGYYCTPRETMGRSGDYLTSPEVSPLFGAMVGRQLREMWEVVGTPSHFDLVEAGAGNGTLCRDILNWAQRTTPELSEAIQYTIVEPIPTLEAKQRERIACDLIDSQVSWLPEMPERVDGCIISNELLDSMSVHRVAITGGDLREIYVNWDGSRFFEELRDPRPAVVRYFERLGASPGEGCRAEVNLEAPRWMRSAASALSRGFVLTFDYGYGAADLYAPWHTDGTLLCFYKHNPSGDPYVRIGRQDMTSHVDFTTLRRAGEEAGLTTVGLTSQAEFLTNVGITEALAPPEGEIDLEERLARRRAVSELIDPAGLGRVKVLAQAKGVPQSTLRGFPAMPEPGEQAPDFTLPSTSGELRLSDATERAKVILAFYYEDATPGCANELSMLRDDYDLVRELGAEVIAVSADNLESHQAFADRLGAVPFPLASDEKLAAATAFDVVDDAGKRSRRAVFVIDRGGSVLHAERWFQPGNPTQYEAIFRALGLEG